MWKRLLPVLLAASSAIGRAAAGPESVNHPSAFIQVAAHPPVPAVSFLGPSGTFPLPSRARSARAKDGEAPAIVSLAFDGGAAGFEVRAPAEGARRPLRAAFLFWNQGEPPLPPASVLMVHVAGDGSPSLGGTVMAAGTAGGPRLLRSGGVWAFLGASVQAAKGRERAVVRVSLPAGVLAELAPDGLLFDVRVLSGERLYSLAPAASWSEPPDPSLAESIRLPWFSSTVPPQTTVAQIASAAKPLVAPPGAQLWAWSREPLPLEADDCYPCVWDAAPGAGPHSELIEGSLRILEEGLTAPPAILSALRNLGRALSAAGIRLPENAELRARVQAAIRDQNSRAAYGADLLLLHEMEAEARLLWEEVLANESASAPARAHALWRLEQLSAAAGDWRGAVKFAERLAATAPFERTHVGSSVIMAPLLTISFGTIGILIIRIGVIMMPPGM